MSALEIALLLDTLGGLVLSLIIWVIYHRLMAMEHAAAQGSVLNSQIAAQSTASFQREGAA